MADLASQLIDWMEAIDPLWAYLVILLIAYGENVVPPIPGDLIVVFGGYLVGIGRLDFVVVVGLATIGGALGFMTMYAFGKYIGEAVLDPERYRWLPKREIRKVRNWLQRWGYGVVAANRFLSGARSVISITVGMAHMPVWRTAALATFSAAVWTTLITYAGYAVGDNWPVVHDYLRQYGLVITILIGVIVVVQIVRAIRSRRAGAADEDVPPSTHDS